MFLVFVGISWVIVFVGWNWWCEVCCLDWVCWLLYWLLFFRLGLWRVCRKLWFGWSLDDLVFWLRNLRYCLFWELYWMEVWCVLRLVFFWKCLVCIVGIWDRECLWEWDCVLCYSWVLECFGLVLCLDVGLFGCDWVDSIFVLDCRYGVGCGICCLCVWYV